MNERLLNIDYVLNSEKKVQYITNQEWGKGNQRLLTIVDILLKSSHFYNENYELESEDNSFYNLAYSSYMRLPYTLLALQDIWQKGYYVESFNLLRHIVEGFVRLRYFINHKENIKKHLVSENYRDRVSFKKMFDEIAPGFYELHYGRLLSGFTHGDLYAYFSRVKIDSNKNARVVIGCEFDLKLSGILINQTLTFCYGYMNYIGDFFPNFYRFLPNKLSFLFDNILKTLKQELDTPRNVHSGQEEWSNVIKPFVFK